MKGEKIRNELLEIRRQHRNQSERERETFISNSTFIYHAYRGECKEWTLERFQKLLKNDLFFTKQDTTIP